LAAPRARRGSTIGAMRRSLLLVALGLAVSAPAAASDPGKKTWGGWVVDGGFYSVTGRAYPIQTPDGYDVKPFEGKEVAIEGWLMPGDRFKPLGAPEVKAPACPAASLRFIRLEEVGKLRLAAKYALRDGAI